MNQNNYPEKYPIFNFWTNPDVDLEDDKIFEIENIDTINKCIKTDGYELPIDILVADDISKFKQYPEIKFVTELLYLMGIDPDYVKSTTWIKMCALSKKHFDKYALNNVKKFQKLSEALEIIKKETLQG